MFSKVAVSSYISTNNVPEFQFPYSLCNLCYRLSFDYIHPSGREEVLICVSLWTSHLEHLSCPHRLLGLCFGEMSVQILRRAASCSLRKLPSQDGLCVSSPVQWL